MGQKVGVGVRIRVRARVGHQEEALGPTPHAQRHGGDVVVGDLRAVLSGCEWYGAVRLGPRGEMKESLGVRA